MPASCLALLAFLAAYTTAPDYLEAARRHLAARSTEAVAPVLDGEISEESEERSNRSQRVEPWDGEYRRECSCCHRTAEAEELRIEHGRYVHREPCQEHDIEGMPQ